ncbi:hypothetical protein MAJ_10699, partial [Metarhizium majus ARSEF 297]
MRRTKSPSKLEEHKTHQDSRLHRFANRVTGENEKVDERAIGGKLLYLAVLGMSQGEQNQDATLDNLLQDAAKARDELQSLSQMHNAAQSRLENIDPVTLERQPDDMTDFSWMDMALRQLEADITPALWSSKAAQYKDDYIGSSKRVLSDAHQSLFSSDAMADMAVRDTLSQNDDASEQTGEELSEADEPATSREEAVRPLNQPGDVSDQLPCGHEAREPRGSRKDEKRAIVLGKQRA